MALKIKKSTWLPILLLAYLAVMATIGWRQYNPHSLQSNLYYWGIVVVTLVVIALLRVNLLRRERERAEKARK